VRDSEALEITPEELADNYSKMSADQLVRLWQDQEDLSDLAREQLQVPLDIRDVRANLSRRIVSHTSREILLETSIEAIADRQRGPASHPTRLSDLWD